MQTKDKSFYLLIPLLAALFISAFVVENPNMVLPLPIGINYALVIIGILFCLAFAFIAIVVYKKKQGQAGIHFLPLTLFFCLPPIYFSLQYLVLGGYEERVFQYFGVVYPLIALLVLSQFTKEALTKFLRIYIQAMLVIVCALTLSSVAYAQYYFYNQVVSQEEVLDEGEDANLTQYKIRQKSDKFFSVLSNKRIALSKDKERSEEGNKVQNAINAIKNYQIKDYYQIPFGGSNYIGSILLVFIAAAALLPHRRKAFNIFYLILGGLSIFLLQSSGAILCFGLLLLIVGFFEREALDGWIQRKFKRSPLTFVRKHRDVFKRALAVLAVSALAIVLVYTAAQYAEGRVLDQTVFDALLTGRVSIYQDTLMYWTHQPFLGFGFQYDAFMSKPHNLFLSLLAYGGIFGLIVFVALLASIFYSAIKYKSKYSHALIAILIVAVVHGLIEPNLLNSMYDLYFWILVSGLLSLHIHEVAPYLKHRALSLSELGKALAAKKLALAALVMFGIALCGASLSGVLSHSYLSEAKLDVIALNEESCPIKVPTEPEVQEEIRETSEKITAGNLMDDEAALRKIAKLGSLKLDPLYPKDVFSAYYDYEDKKLTLRIISYTKDKDLREAQAQSIQSYVINYQEELTPFVIFMAGDVHTQDGASTKVQAMKVILSLVFMVTSSLVLALYTYKE